MERETGIEPATNSLEGCDSTTELLPPTRSPLCLLALWREGPPFAFRLARKPATQKLFTRISEYSTCLAEARRRMARGGFEPPKSQGRQIYSLLRLTASLPRRNFPAVSAAEYAPRLTARDHDGLSGFAC
jgi:hypothetical protein